MPKLLPSNAIVPEKRKTSSNHGSGNSSPSLIHIGIPFGNGQCESAISINLLVSVFKANLLVSLS